MSNHLKFQARGNYFKNIEKPFSAIAYYSSKRVLDAYNDKEQSRSGQMYAYVNAFNPKIDFSSSLAWFIEKASQEALEAKRLKNLNHTIPELSAVRMAISKALGVYDEPYVGETPPKLFISIKDHPSQAFRIEQLSDGYRTMLALSHRTTPSRGGLEEAPYKGALILATPKGALMASQAG